MAHQAGDDDHHHPLLRHAEFGADAAAGFGVGAEAGGVATVADTDRPAVDVQPPRVGRLLVRDGHVHVGQPPADPFHDEGEAAPRDQRPGWLNRKPWHV